MGNTLKYFLLLVFGVATFWSCSDDDFYNENYNNTYNEKGLKISRITGSKAEQLAGKLKIETLSNTGVVYKTTNTGTINYDEILEVIDTLGNTNYTFRIEGHPKESERSFFNLVVNVKDGQQKVYVLEYEMDEDFVLAYSSGQKSLEQFDGMITAGRLGEEVPCPEFEVPIRGGIGNGGNNPGNGTGINPGNNMGDAPGGVVVPNPGDNNSNPGSGTNPGGSPGTGGDPIEPGGCADPGSAIYMLCDYYGGFINSECECEGAVWPGPSQFKKIGNNLIVENFGKKMINPNDPCAELELTLGVLEPHKGNCEDLKSKSEDSDFVDKLKDLRDNEADNEFEAGYVMYKDNPNYSEKQYGGIDQNGTYINFEYDTSRLNKITGYMHSHQNDAEIKNLAVFSIDDLVAFKELIENSTVPVKELTIYVTSGQGTYALKITNKQSFINVMNKVQDPVLKYIYAAKHTNKVNAEDSTEEQIIGLLKFIGEDLPNSSFRMYEATGSDFQQWKELSLSSNGYNVDRKDCN